MRVSQGLLLSLVVSCALIPLDCAGPRPEVRAALYGTLPQLQQQIAQAERQGPLSDARLSDLAYAVA